MSAQDPGEALKLGFFFTVDEVKETERVIVV